MFVDQQRQARCALVSVFCVALSAAESAPTLVELTVHPNQVAPSTDLLPHQQRADLGALLRQEPGLDAVRMGGLGLDPVYRGQSGQRLLVLVDGACPQGACPNRMDPPTTYAPAGLDALRVFPGGWDARYFGAAAARVEIDRDWQPFLADERLRAAMDTRYDSNGARWETGATTEAGNQQGQLRADAHLAQGNDYQDGSGAEVHSQYRSTKAGLAGLWQQKTGLRVEVAADGVWERDTAYAGAGMDAIFSDGVLLRAQVGQEMDHGTWQIEAQRNTVDHLMDNYSLRNVAGMLMRAPSTSEVSAVSANWMQDLSSGHVRVALDVYREAQDARRYSGLDATQVDTLQSVLWPDVERERLGLALEWQNRIGPGTFTGGLRLDKEDRSAKAADQDPPGMPLSPSALYQMYYGVSGAERDYELVTLSLRWEQPVAPDWTLAAVLARTPRTPDATESQIAANGMTPVQRWVGNPDLDAEIHHQALLRVERSGEQSLRVELWADVLHDAILRDRARAQSGVLQSDGASVYRNGQALLWGGLLSAASPVWRGGRLSGDLNYTWGEDRDRGLPLPQIPPWSGQIQVEQTLSHALLTALTLRGALEQTRVDDDPSTGSGLDHGPSDAWAVLDWELRWQPNERWDLAVGVTNILNATYADHLNKPGAFDPTVEQVREPGRSFWTSVQARW